MPHPGETRPSQSVGVTIQLFLFVFFPLTLLLLAVTFGSLSLHHQAMRTLVADRDLRAVQEASDSLNLALSHQAATIQLLSDMLGSQTDLTFIVKTSSQSLLNFDQGLALFTSSDQLLSSTSDASAWQALLALNQSVMAAFLEKSRGGATFSQAMSSPDGKIIMLVSAPASGDRVLVGAFLPDNLIRSALHGLFGSGQVSVWIAAPGQGVIFHSSSLVTEGNLLAHPGTQGAINGESGITFTPANQGNHVIAYTPVLPVGWGLVLEESWESITSPLLNTTQFAPLVLVPVVLLMLVAVWFGLHQIVQPLRDLQARAAELAGGNFDSIHKPVGGVHEIGELQTQLGDMAVRLKSAQESLHQYIGAMTASVEAERKNLARELHDDTLQALIATNQRLQLASANPAQDRKLLLNIQDLVGQTIVSIRRLVRGLRPIYLEDLGLAAALGMLANEVQQNQSLVVGFEAGGTERRLPAEIEIALYRIAQEALSNVVRHAKAAHAWVRLDYLPEKVVLLVRDDGSGFLIHGKPDDFAGSGHYGLLGMAERADLVNARLSITSKPGSGTLVQVEVPVSLAWEDDISAQGIDREEERA